MRIWLRGCSQILVLGPAITEIAAVLAELTMTTAASAAPADSPDIALLAVPVLLALSGAALRFCAYLSITAQPSAQGFVDAMCVWDCTWYANIVEHGYQAYPETLNFGGPAGIANWAFFPAYPLLVAAVQRLSGAPPALLGMLVSSLLTLGAVLVARPLFGTERRAYLLFAAFLLVGPFSFYFSILYSESLFLLATVLAFRLLQRGKFVAAGLAGALLSATRTVGVLFVFALLVAAVGELRHRPWREAVRRPDVLLGLLLAPAGLFAFMAWLYFTTGDALAFAHIQRAWDREMVNPALALWAALASPMGQVREAPLLALASLAGLALTALLAIRRDVPAAIFCALCLGLALTQGVESMLRFVAALAPLGIMLCRLLAARRWLFWLSLVVFAGLDFAFTIGWMHQHGALM